VNLVLVPVVVRDDAGHAVGNLRPDDFRVFDNGKRQQIQEFVVEEAAERPPEIAGVAQPQGGSMATSAFHPFVAPKSFTALFFDDLHLDFESLSNVRNASFRYLSKAALSTERVGVFTSSGKTTLDFTDDRAKLDDMLNRIRPQHLPGAGMKDCPELSHYQAHEIMNNNDQGAMHLAISDAIMFCGARNEVDGAEMAVQAAKRSLDDGDRQARSSLNSVRDLVARLAATPGQRNLIVVSPGFLVTADAADQARVIDFAIRSRVIISALDARGLYAANLLGDAAQRVGGPATAVGRMNSNAASSLAVEGVLSVFANETGGTFFRNSNDLEAGFLRVGGVPEYTYLLGFSPSNVKFDGKLHTLKVTLEGRKGLTVTARRSYIATGLNAPPEDAAKLEMQEALFSSGQTRDLPIEMLVRTVKGDAPLAQLTVQASVDLALLPFRFLDGQKRNQLTFVTAVFDRDGKYLDGNTLVLGVHWKTEASEGASQKENAAEISFPLKPGDYLIRFVARDSETQHLFAETAPVHVP
jgi:VWFA-related protein